MKRIQSRSVSSRDKSSGTHGESVTESVKVSASESPISDRVNTANAIVEAREMILPGPSLNGQDEEVTLDGVELEQAQLDPPILHSESPDNPDVDEGALDLKLLAPSLSESEDNAQDRAWRRPLLSKNEVANSREVTTKILAVTKIQV